MTTPVDHKFRWNRLVFVYLALSAGSLLLSQIPLPAAILVPLMAILGPTAWLAWGYPLAPFYLLATAVFAICLVGAIFVDAKSRTLGRLALWIMGVVWLLLGLSAYGFSV
jgi:hypothetical protein